MAGSEGTYAGIDLGTTNTMVSYYDGLTGQGKCCEDLDDDRRLPSAVCFETADVYAVGKNARDEALLYPDRTVLNVKRKMGITDRAITVDGKTYSPQQISALIVKEAITCANREMGTQIRKAVIPIPVDFGSNSIRATKDAGAIAGLEKVRTIEEPVAAVLSYLSEMDLSGQTVMVVDIGGGTADVAVLEIEKEVIRVAAVRGDRNLGGADIDRLLVKYVREKYLGGEMLDSYGEQDLLREMESAKISLTKREKTMRVARGGKGPVPVGLTRQELTECMKPILERLRAVLEGAARDAAEQGICIDQILLAGGMTKMPQIERLIREMFPDTGLLAHDRDAAVAKGAAVYAKLLYGAKEGSIPEICNPFMPGRLELISKKSYGLAALQGENGERKICNLICRSEKLPISKMKSFYTSVNHQKRINLRVYETVSDEQYTEICPDALLGSCILEIPEDIPKGSEVEVMFSLNKEGVLSVSGRETMTGREVNAAMESKALFSADKLMDQKADIDRLERPGGFEDGFLQ